MKFKITKKTRAKFFSRFMIFTNVVLILIVAGTYIPKGINMLASVIAADSNQEVANPQEEDVGAMLKIGDNTMNTINKYKMSDLIPIVGDLGGLAAYNADTGELLFTTNIATNNSTQIAASVFGQTGNYVLVNTNDMNWCSQFTLDECRKASGYISESSFTIVSDENIKAGVNVDPSLVTDINPTETDATKTATADPIKDAVSTVTDSVAAVTDTIVNGNSVDTSAVLSLSNVTSQELDTPYCAEKAVIITDTYEIVDGKIFYKATKGQENYLCTLVEAPHVPISRVKTEETSGAASTQTVAPTEVSAPSVPVTTAETSVLETETVPIVPVVPETSTVPSVDGTSSTSIETTVPAESVVPADTTAPVESAPAPVVDTPAPVVDAPAPVVDAPAPVVDTPAPVVDTPAPVVDTPAPSDTSF